MAVIAFMSSILTSILNKSKTLTSDTDTGWYNRKAEEISVKYLLKEFSTH